MDFEINLKMLDNICHIANVGDSRALMSCSYKKGANFIQNKVIPLTRDHRPMDEIEYRRITENGGKVYQTQALARVPGPYSLRSQCMLGPHRVFPGRLSVNNKYILNGIGIKNIWRH
jgi:serine/threonine protein phosphatase PrpC